MRCFFIFLVLSVWSASGAWELREVQLFAPQECSYDGRSFFVFENLGSIPSAEENALWWYLLGPHSRVLGDTASLALQSQDMIEEVLRLLNSVKPSRRSLPYVPLGRSDLLLVAEYRFPHSPDFLLAKYKADILNPNVFVAFTRSKSKAYVFGIPAKKESDHDSTVEVFNRMLSENPNVLDESPLCKAQMLVLFKFCAQFAPMILPSSPDDALGYVAMLQVMAQRETPPYLRTFDDLYLSGIASDTLAAPYVEWNSSRLELAKVLRDSMPKDSGLWLPPQTIVRHDTTTVLFTASDANLGRLARWRVVFVGGLVQSVDTVAGPYAGPLHDLCKYFVDCPFFYVAGWIRPHLDSFDGGL